MPFVKYLRAGLAAFKKQFKVMLTLNGILFPFFNSLGPAVSVGYVVGRSGNETAIAYVFVGASLIWKWLCETLDIAQPSLVGPTRSAATRSRAFCLGVVADVEDTCCELDRRGCVDRGLEAVARDEAGRADRVEVDPVGRVGAVLLAHEGAVLDEAVADGADGPGVGLADAGRREVVE